MKNRIWVNLVMAVLVAALFLTVSCAKKTVVSDASTIEDQAMADAKAKEEADRIAKQKIDEQMAKEQAIAQAKADFINLDVLFAYDSSDLDSDAVMMLKAKAAWLKAMSDVKVTIQGHCDQRGTTEYNLALGERRASVVKAYMINLGISASRLSTISYGEEKPKAGGNTEEDYRQNRRAHFAID